MFGKLRPRTLLIIAALLAIVWFLADRFSTGARQRTFRSEVFSVDTATVTRMAIRARSVAHEEAVLERKGREWSISFKGTTYSADEANVSNLLGQFTRMKADHLVGTSDAVRDRYGLSDSLVSVVELTTADGRSRSLRIGKVSADESGQRMTAVQVEGEKEVYATPGMLGNMVDSPPLTSLRPRALIKGDPLNWSRLVFTYPADTGYVLERDGSRWLVDSMPADSSKVNKFLKSLALCKAQQFADTVNVEGLPLTYQVAIDDASRPEPIQVSVFTLGYGYVVTSNINPGTVMWFDAMREVPRLFRPRHNWFETLPPS